MTYNLWQIRTAKGYSLRELEELSGVSKTTINNIENGKANPTIETLRLLAAAPRSRAIRFTRIIILQVTVAKSYGAYVRHNGQNSRKSYISYRLAL